LTSGKDLTQTEANALNALLINEEQAIGYAQAVLTSVERTQGAAVAGDAYWEAQQLQAAEEYSLQLAARFMVQPVLRADVQSALQAAGFPSVSITAADVSDFQSDVAVNGLPPSLEVALDQLGADSAAIEEIRNLLIAQDPNAVAGSFPEMLMNPALVTALQEVAQSLYEFAEISPVSIDIQPGSSPNIINAKIRGKIPVAILSTAQFDAVAQLNQGSLTFGRMGVEMSLASCNSTDVNGDGLLDLVCHFNTQQSGFQSGDTQGILRGSMIDGTSIAGTEKVRIIPLK